MKVLTIKQPFASLIAEGLKEYEFRTWKTKYRGEFLIHAGKSIDEKAMKQLKIEPIPANGKLSFWEYEYNKDK